MYYFAYGSNMNWPQMKQRCPSARFISLARLKGHRFAITRQSKRRKCGTADVLPDESSEVWGIVYEISDSEVCMLDDFEDGYRRENVLVEPVGDGKQPFRVLIYVAEKEANPPSPSADYAWLILEGAKHWGLPPGYIQMLERLEVAK
jgi:gamma-glutamylcyclotransferase (GGCT)/AIG2-like uncharacterized protein YtfP